MIHKEYYKNKILNDIFQSTEWDEPSKLTQITLKQIQNNYSDALKDFQYINSLLYLKSNVSYGSLIRYFTYDGDIRFGGILIKKIFVNKNNIPDCILFIKNKNNKTSKLYFNNYFVYFKQNKKHNDLRNILISYLPENAKEDLDI